MKKNLILLAVFLCFTCSEIYEIQDISEDHVKLLAPTQDAVIDKTALTFTWSPLEDAEEYHLQIAQPSFSAALQIVEDTLVSTTNYSTTLDASNYQWRVRAENSGYNTGYTIQDFTIEE